MATAAAADPSLARDRAFENLYRRYVEDVYRYALALLRNPADAEDVTQTTFLNAYRAYRRGEEPIKPQNWLIKIAHNAARTRYARMSRRVREVPLDDHIEQLAVPEENKADVEVVLKALGRLPLNQRAALVMRELEGRTYAEIADMLGVSVAAVETLIFRARRSLRLKSSAVRALGAVQLPASLAQLLEAGGGGVAGGTALVGSGFLFKALIAVVAGTVAAGLAANHSRPTAVAATPTTGVASTADVARAAPTPATAHSRSPVVRAKARGANGSRVALAPPSVGPRTDRAAGTGAQPASKATQPSSTSRSQPISTSTVTSAVSSATSSLPPVSAPAVSVPPPPAVPATPALPAAPALPALPPPPSLP